MISQQSEMLTDYDEGKKLAAIALSRLRKEDIVHRGFLRPIQIALKSAPTDPLPPQPHHIPREHRPFEEQDETPTHPSAIALPVGLRVAVKHSICDNRYVLRQLGSAEEAGSYQALKENSMDNLLSLIKTKEGIELAICVCMYSEDKKMLKSTISGIAENVAQLALHCAVDPDRIGVFVLMDGIQKVDPSVVDYFVELQRSSGMNLGENLPPALTIDEVSRRAASMSEEEINEEELRNVNTFLFNPAELQDRNERSFPTLREEYLQIKQLMATVQTLKKQKPHFDDLPAKARPFFFAEARLLKKKLAHLSEREASWLTEDALLQQFGLDSRRARPLIVRALVQCERYCKEYIDSRAQLAYLAAFRCRVKAGEENEVEQKSDDESSLASGGTDRHLLQEAPHQLVRIPMNLFLCVKYKNSGKLSSHNWFFNGFCRELRPKYSVLLDVGLKPQGSALVKMYRYMRERPEVGGVCGYMSLKIEQLEEQEEEKLGDIDFLSKICLKVADIQRTQQVEYHFAHLMDKGFEASFGFIHVLPGAFSAYNMAAILNYADPQHDTLLRAYFKSIDQKLASTRVIPSELSLGSVLLRVLLPQAVGRWWEDVHPDSQEQMLYNENIYLAEDRILCMGIHRKGYQIKYLPDAYAEVDPIKTVHGLLGQRKRWINGSFFAFERVKRELGKHQQRQGVEFCLNLQILYLTMMNALAYFAPAFFLFTVHIAMDSFRVDVLTSLFSGFVADANNSPALMSFVYLMDFIYVMLVLTVIYYSLHLTHGAKHFKPYIYAVSTLFGLFAVAVFLVLAVDVFRGLIDNAQFLIENQALVGHVPGGMATLDAMRWVLIASTMLFAVPVAIYAILFKKFHVACEVMVGAFSFIFYGPTYLNLLNIYALCRIDDISWGTKGLQAGGGSGKHARLKEKWYLLKMVQVGKFLLWNTVVGVVLLSVGADYQPRFFITLIMVSVITLTLAVKVAVSVFYLISYKLSTACDEELKVCPQGLAVARQSRIEGLFDLYHEDVLQEVRAHLLHLAQKYNSSSKSADNPHLGPRPSFLQLSRVPSFVLMAQQRMREQFASRSQLSQQLSFMEGMTQKKPSQNNSSHIHINLFNEFNLPIETRNALDVLSDMNKRNSAISLDKRPSNFSLDKRASIVSLDKRPSFPSLDKRPSFPSLDHRPSLQSLDRGKVSHFSMDKQMSQPSLEKKSSEESPDRQASKNDLEKKNSMHESIRQEEEQEEPKLSAPEEITPHLEEVQEEKHSIEEGQWVKEDGLDRSQQGSHIIMRGGGLNETIKQENESQQMSMHQLIPEPLTPISVQIHPKRRQDTPVASRFKPQDK